jgi:predicted nucleic acid-binding protein
MRLVLDASVAIASLRLNEPAYPVARARVRRLVAGDDVAVVPSLFVPEVSGALARLGFNAKAIETFVAELTRPPHEVVAIGPKRAHAAARLAVATKLPGIAATYVWLATREGLPICTFDRDIIERGSSACEVAMP